MDATSSTPYQLSTLAQPANAPRPTIPYSQFPRTRLSDWQDREAGQDEELYSTDGSDAYLSDEDYMEPASASSRRRSANMHSGSSAATGTEVHQGGRSSQKGGIIDERRGPGFDGQYSGEESEGSRAGDVSDDDGLNDDEETGLTGIDKRRRRERRNRNTQFDQRIAAEGSGTSKGGTTAEEKKEANQNVVKRMGINVLLIGLWCGPSPRKLH